MTPLYGFLEGDTMGLLIFAYEEETVGDLARKLERAAALRVAPKPRVTLIHRDRPVDPSLTVRAAGLEALDRFDVVEDRS